MVKTPGFKKGKSGNPSGRPKGTDYVKQLDIALRIAEKKEGRSILVHFVEKAYQDNKVLIALLKKILPDLKHNDNTGDVSLTLEAIIHSLANKKNADS